MRSFDLLMSSGFLCFSSHCGMLRALEDKGLAPSAYVGTSSGALAAAMSAAGLSADEVARELGGQRPIALCRPGRPSRSGFMSTRALVQRLRSVLPPTFEELAKPCAVGVYDEAGLPLLVTSGDLPLAVAASCAVPRLFKPLPLEGRGCCAERGDVELQMLADSTSLYADGGAVDRTGYRAWQRWRPGHQGLVHLVSALQVGEYGTRDGVDDTCTNLLGVVRTPRARANFFSLRDFEGQVELAAEVARQGLKGM